MVVAEGRDKGAIGLCWGAHLSWSWGLERAAQLYGSPWRPGLGVNMSPLLELHTTINKFLITKWCLFNINLLCPLR